MEIRFKHAVGGCAIAALAACGGSGSGNTVLGPGDVVDGTVAISYDPTTAGVTLNGTTIVDPRATVLATNGAARLFADGSDTHRSALAENADVYAISVATDGIAPEFVGAAFGRRGETVLPDGTATFSGDYAGLTVFARPTDDIVTSILTGDVALSVDFDNDSLTGDITNRQVLRPDGTNFVAYGAEDVSISGGALAANGTFAATTTGGAFTSTFAFENWSVAPGTVAGVFGGPDGESVAGILRLTHNESTGADEFNEVGTLIATAD